MANLFNKILCWITWPAVYLMVNNTERTRAVIINQKKELLVVRGWINDGKWQLPGGGIKKNETSLDATIREVEEEVNLTLDADKIRLIGSEKIIDNKISYKCDFFLVDEVDSKNAKAGSEIKEFKFIEIDKAENIAKEVILAIKLINA